MPTRIIREGILTSVAVNKLSAGAELFYRRLMSVADDHGRFYSHPTILRSHCFPLKIDDVKESDVRKWLEECTKATDDDGTPLVSIYGAGKHILIHKFGQQTRSRSKFPEPTENELLIKCLSNDTQLITGFASAPTTTTHSTTTPNGSKILFQKPTVDEIKLHMVKSGAPESEALKFFNYYESNGWRVGRNPMKVWKGAASNWVANWRQRKYEQDRVQKGNPNVF